MKQLVTILLMLMATTVSAQSLQFDLHRSDSIMALLQQKYEFPHELHTDDAEQKSLVVRQYGSLSVNPQAVYVPGFWVPDPPSLFEEEDERRWMYEDHTLGEEIVQGVLNTLLDGLTIGKKKKKR